MLTGIEQIARERQRQITAEGYTAAHDDNPVNGELRDAAIAYCMVCDDRAGEQANSIWPWETATWKPSDDPVRNLVRAGALIAAEIDRLTFLRSAPERRVCPTPVAAAAADPETAPPAGVLAALDTILAEVKPLSAAIDSRGHCATCGSDVTPDHACLRNTPPPTTAERLDVKSRAIAALHDLSHTCEAMLKAAATINPSEQERKAALLSHHVFVGESPCTDGRTSVIDESAYIIAQHTRHEGRTAKQWHDEWQARVMPHLFRAQTAEAHAREWETTAGNLLARAEAAEMLAADAAERYRQRAETAETELVCTRQNLMSAQTDCAKLWVTAEGAFANRHIPEVIVRLRESVAQRSEIPGQANKSDADILAICDALAHAQNRWHRFNLAVEKLPRYPQSDYPTGDPATDIELLGAAYVQLLRDKASADILLSRLTQNTSDRNACYAFQQERNDWRRVAKQAEHRADELNVELQALQKKYENLKCNCRLVQATLEQRTNEANLAAATAKRLERELDTTRMTGVGLAEIVASLRTPVDWPSTAETAGHLDVARAIRRAHLLHHVAAMARQYRDQGRYHQAWYSLDLALKSLEQDDATQRPLHSPEG